MVKGFSDCVKCPRGESDRLTKRHIDAGNLNIGKFKEWVGWNLELSGIKRYECKSCPSGKTADLSEGNGVGSTSIANCVACVAGKFSNEGAPVCSDCAAARWSAADSSDCTSCSVSGVMKLVQSTK